MAVPVLPLDVIHLIACYLVGMCAFASIAALRLVDRAVEETVLPVLYETISAEDIKILSSSTDSRDKRRLEAMRRYTKFLICSALQYNLFKADGIELPNLVAVLHIQREVLYPRTMVEYLEVTLHKPVSTTTLFGSIAFTKKKPVPPMSSKYARATARMLGLRRISSPSQLPKECPDEHPYARELVDLIVEDGAILIAGSPVPQSWKTHTQPVRANCRFVSNNQADEDAIETILEVLKLAGRQCDPEKMRRRDTKLRSNTEGKNDYHVLLDMTSQRYDAFAERFRLECNLHPEILLNRIQITIADIISLERHRELVDDLLAIYVKHVRSYGDILPGIGPPSKLFTLKCKPPQTSGLHPRSFSVELRGSEHDIRFVNAEGMMDR